jgi:hypothetical protein
MAKSRASFLLTESAGPASKNPVFSTHTSWVGFMLLGGESLGVCVQANVSSNDGRLKSGRCIDSLSVQS